MLHILFLTMPTLKKHSIKMINNLVWVSPQKIVIPIPLLIFFNEILYLYSQLEKLPNICQKIFLT